MNLIRFSFLLLMIPFVSVGQVTVENTSFTVEEYLINELIGSGVTVSNVMFNGAPANINSDQVGSFDVANQDVGLTGGLIMGSGDVSIASQPNTSSSSTSGGSGAIGSDPDLASITTNTVYDECVIEFDFVPVGDTLMFNYVFASEEYDEYVCGTVNDAFGFFLTGPNPAGGNYNADNLALIPDPSNPGQYTNTPVSINTVNLGVPGGINSSANCESIDPNWTAYNIFYTQNTVGTYEYDGRTVVLESKVSVICGETYHIKLAIGDAGDSWFDSGVFLKRGSFTSPAVQVSLGGTITGGNEVVEGCTNAELWFVRPDTTEADTIYYSLTGSAINGVDYDQIPDSVYFAQGQDSASVLINPILDGVFEAADSIYIEAYTISPCGDTLVTSETIYILDSLAIEILTENEWNLCPGQPTELTAEVSNGIEPYNYSWYNIETGVTYTDDTITVTPVQADTFLLTITDFCGFYMSTDTIIISDSIADPIVITLPNDSTFICADNFIVNPTVTGGIEPYNYLWNNSSTTLNQQLSVTEDSVMVITVTDFCGIQEVNDVNVFYNYTNPTLTMDFDNETLICPGDDISIVALASNGVEPYQYNWSSGSNTSTEVVTVSNDVTVNLIVTDYCGNTVSGDADLLVPVIDPIVVSPIDSVFDCIGREITISPVFVGGQSPYTYSWIGIGGNYASVSEYTFVLTSFPDQITFTVMDVCGNIGSTDFSVDSEDCTLHFPNIFTPNGDSDNEYFAISGLDNFPNTQLTIYNRWGKKIYQSDNYDNLWDGENHREGVYYYVATDFEGGQYSGYFHLIR